MKEYYKREENKTKGFNFACCIDGSKKSLETLKHAKALARNPKDKVGDVLTKIYAVTIDEAGDYAFLRDRVKDVAEAAAKEYGVKYEHLFGAKTTDTASALKSFIEDHPDVVFDFVVLGGMGVHGEADKTYTQGKIATAMMNKCFLNPIFIP